MFFPNVILSPFLLTESFGVILVAVSVLIVSFITSYLQTGFEKQLQKFETFVKNPKKLTKINDKLIKMELSEEEKNELQKIIKAQLIKESAENLKEEFEEKFKKELTYNGYLLYAKNSFINTNQRLKNEIASLNRRSNLNLAIGITITGLGFYLLYNFVLNGDLEHNNTNSFLIQFLPRISLVIFIEVFAFFFLSLYKKSLLEIKYYQSELTKIEANYVALITAHSLNSGDIISEVLRGFSSNLGSSNVQNEDSDIQQVKLSGDNVVEILGKVLDVYKKS